MTDDRRVDVDDSDKSVRRLRLKPHDALARMRRERENHNKQVGGRPLEENNAHADTEYDPLSRRQ